MPIATGVVAHAGSTRVPKPLPDFLRLVHDLADDSVFERFSRVHPVVPVAVFGDFPQYKVRALIISRTPVFDKVGRDFAQLVE